jgi:glyceraldehyde 3-phosphate dehydrogenase
VHGIFQAEVGNEGDNTLIVDGKRIAKYATREPTEIPWAKHDVDVVIESTGVFTDVATSSKHLQAGAKKVLLSAPAKDKTIPMYVLGVNEKDYKPGEKIISMASCTTNCLAPIMKIIDREFTVKKGFMTTVHAYTNDQRLFDLPHKDLRRSRAAPMNIIPTTTGAAKSIGVVLPKLKGSMDGISLRVPVADGSITDISVHVDKKTTPEEINLVLKKAAETELKGILEYSDLPLVSVDIIGNKHSAIVDALSTQVVDGNFLKILAWYDNEIGYSQRLIDFIVYMQKNGGF